MLFFFQGIPNTSYLLSTIGITSTIGRVACGYVADFPQVDTLLLNNICLIAATIVVTLTAFCYNFIHYLIISGFFGLAICKYLFEFK